MLCGDVSVCLDTDGWVIGMTCVSFITRGSVLKQAGEENRGEQLLLDKWLLEMEVMMVTVAVMAVVYVCFKVMWT